MGLIMTKKHAPQYFICNLNFESHDFQTESPFKRVAPTYIGITALSCFSLCYALCLGHQYAWVHWTKVVRAPATQQLRLGPCYN
jgi:hypothetical protein